MNVVDEKDLSKVITAFMTRKEAKTYIKNNGLRIVGELGANPAEPDLLPRPALIVKTSQLSACTPDGVDYADCDAIQLQAECYRLRAEHAATLAAFQKILANERQSLIDHTIRCEQEHRAAALIVSAAQHALLDKQERRL